MIKDLLKYVGEYKKASIFTILCVVVSVALDIYVPVLMATLLDKGVAAGDPNVLTRLGIKAALLVALSLILGATSGRLGAIASAGYAKNLRQGMFYKIQDFSFANLDKFSVPGLITRLTTDVNNVQMFYLMTIRMAIRAPLTIIFSIASTIMINKRLALIFLIMIPVLLIGLIILMSAAMKIFRVIFKDYDRLNRVIQENLIGIRVVKSFVREDEEIEKFDNVTDDIKSQFLKADRILAMNMPLMQTVIYVSILGISWIGANLIVRSNQVAMTTGELSTVVTYVLLTLNSLMMLSFVFVRGNIALAGGERIYEVLTEEIDITNPENPITTMENADVVFDDVCFEYPGEDNVSATDINLIIPQGSTLGIVGSTGSGKSTLVQLIPRLYDVSRGSVTIGGVDVRDYDINTLRDNVSMVLQRNELFTGTLEDNLRWGNKHATMDQIIKASKMAQAHDFIEDFIDGYQTQISQGGTNLSGGQKQRVTIARALLKDPKILILDDSTSAVDTKTDAAIRRAFREDLPDMTKIIISQRISSIMDADNIVVMDSGRILDQGTHDELIDRCSIYNEIYVSQEGEDNE